MQKFMTMRASLGVGSRGSARVPGRRGAFCTGAGMPEALIRTDKLRKDFSAVTVLKGISIAKRWG